MQQSLGQSVIIDNRGGAAGNIGMGHAARAKPGRLHAADDLDRDRGQHRRCSQNLPYDPIKDFAPISELVNAPNVLCRASRFRHHDDRRPGRAGEGAPNTFNYGSPGAGTKSHLTGELLKLRAGIDMVHVPFRGARTGGAGACWPGRCRSPRSRSPPPSR